MANYTGKGRTNYFKVKDLDAFIEAISQLPVEYHFDAKGEALMVMDDDPDGGGWNNGYWDEETGEWEEIDLAKIIAEHLCDEEVAVILEVGSEKYRYLSGYAEAVNNRGESRSVNLNQIYNLAKELGSHITDASY